MPITRYVATIADGGTDHDVLFKVVSCLLGTGYDIEHIELQRQHVRDDMDRYWRARDSGEEYILPLRDAIPRLLMAAISDFKDEIGRDLLPSDFIILNTDSERYWGSIEDYFSDWAWEVTKIFDLGIDRFRHIKIRQGYLAEQFPTIVPLVLFPSTDKIIAVARGIHPYGLKAKELKYRLYGTTDLRQVSYEQFEIDALAHVTKDSLSNIYSLIPEIRDFMVRVASSYGCLREFRCREDVG